MVDRQNRSNDQTFSARGLRAEQDDAQERVRQNALSSVNLSKDPYHTLMRDGKVMCKLCKKLFKDEMGYLDHTQRNKHQLAIASFVQRQKDEQASRTAPADGRPAQRQRKSIGQPKFSVKEVRDRLSPGIGGVLVEVEFGERDPGARPFHRIVGAVEQKVDLPADASWVYLVIACAPYDNIAIKVPKAGLLTDRTERRTFAHWNCTTNKFTVQQMWNLSLATGKQIEQ